MDLANVTKQPGTLQSTLLDQSGQARASSGAAHVPLGELAAIRDMSVSVGKGLGLGALVTGAFDDPKHAAIILIGSGTDCAVIVSAPLGSALDARTQELRAALIPRDSLIVRTMGFAEVRR